mmetsp:Transcript_11270/g.27487  ORF Transcript_11270/g.27487 Transcript_11270/m.27487 type:complete len:652 (-) Transcript_11270:303-2258(-)
MRAKVTVTATTLTETRAMAPRGASPGRTGPRAHGPKRVGLHVLLRPWRRPRHILSRLWRKLRRWTRYSRKLRRSSTRAAPRVCCSTTSASTAGATSASTARRSQTTPTLPTRTSRRWREPPWTCRPCATSSSARLGWRRRRPASPLRSRSLRTCSRRSPAPSHHPLPPPLPPPPPPGAAVEAAAQLASPSSTSPPTLRGARHRQVVRSLPTTTMTTTTAPPEPAATTTLAGRRLTLATTTAVVAVDSTTTTTRRRGPSDITNTPAAANLAQSTWTPTPGWSGSSTPEGKTLAERWRGQGPATGASRRPPRLLVSTKAAGRRARRAQRSLRANAEKESLRSTSKTLRSRTRRGSHRRPQARSLHWYRLPPPRTPFSHRTWGTRRRTLHGCRCGPARASAPGGAAALEPAPPGRVATAVNSTTRTVKLAVVGSISTMMTTLAAVGGMVSTTNTTLAAAETGQGVSTLLEGWRTASLARTGWWLRHAEWRGSAWTMRAPLSRSTSRSSRQLCGTVYGTRASALPTPPQVLTHSTRSSLTSPRTMPQAPPRIFPCTWPSSVCCTWPTSTASPSPTATRSRTSTSLAFRPSRRRSRSLLAPGRYRSLCCSHRIALPDRQVADGGARDVLVYPCRIQRDVSETVSCMGWVCVPAHHG